MCIAPIRGYFVFCRNWVLTTVDNGCKILTSNAQEKMKMTNNNTVYAMMNEVDYLQEKHQGLIAGTQMRTEGDYQVEIKGTPEQLREIKNQLNWNGPNKIN